MNDKITTVKELNEALEVVNTGKTLEDYRKEITVNECRWCDFKGLSNLPIEHYPHSGGWDVEGFDEKQWLYIVCPKCKYQWALWKLGVKR